MQFEKSNRGKKIGIGVGFVIMYLIFTTILFYILTFLDKIPESWNGIHIGMITLFITLLGILIKQLLR